MGYLDPYLGRWLSIDPLFATSNAQNLGSFGESTTAYAYVAGNLGGLMILDIAEASARQRVGGASGAVSGVCTT